VEAENLGDEEDGQGPLEARVFDVTRRCHDRVPMRHSQRPGKVFCRWSPPSRARGGQERGPNRPTPCLKLPAFCKWSFPSFPSSRRVQVSLPPATCGELCIPVKNDHFPCRLKSDFSLQGKSPFLQQG
jgi:hypothetical protein